MGNGRQALTKPEELLLRRHSLSCSSYCQVTSLQEKVDAEIDKLLQQGHIEKLTECSDKYFVSPIVITVKKDGSVKLALESREVN